MGLTNKSMRVCFKIITIFVPYIWNSWYGANRWKHFMRKDPFSYLFLALLAIFRVIVDWRRCKKRFVAIESLNITLEKVLRRIAIYALIIALWSLACLWIPWIQMNIGQFIDLLAISLEPKRFANKRDIVLFDMRWAFSDCWLSKLFFLCK